MYPYEIRRMLELPQGAAEIGGIALAPPGRDHRVTRQVGRQVGGNRDRAHAGPAAAVRNRERLVQVQVAHVGADCRRARQADLRVHVRAVHVDLAAVLVHDRADFLDRLLEHAEASTDR